MRGGRGKRAAAEIDAGLTPIARAGSNARPLLRNALKNDLRQRRLLRVRLQIRHDAIAHAGDSVSEEKSGAAVPGELLIEDQGGGLNGGVFGLNCGQAAHGIDHQPLARLARRSPLARGATLRKSAHACVHNEVVQCARVVANRCRNPVRAAIRGKADLVIRARAQQREQCGQYLPHGYCEFEQPMLTLPGGLCKAVFGSDGTYASRWTQSNAR